MEEERVVYSVVCAPEIADSDGEILTAEEIRHAQQKFMEEYQHIDKDHDYAKYSSFENVGNVVESYITDEDMTKEALTGVKLTIPKGSWIIGIKVTNDDLLDKIKKGIYPGVSVTGVPAAAKSKTLIKDLGEKWKAKTVSIVQEPANPIALFFAIKEKGGNEIMVDYKNFYETIITAIKQISDEKEKTVDTSNEEEDVSKKSMESEEDKVEKACNDEKEAEKSEEDEDDMEKTEDASKADDFEEKVEEKSDMMVTDDELETKIEEAIREKEAINRMVKDLDARLSAIEETFNEPAESMDEIVDKADEKEEKEENKDESSTNEETESESPKDIDDEEDASKSEEDDKDKKIAELEAKIKELETKSASKSKSLSVNQNKIVEKQKSVSLYEKLGRDCMGRKI